MVEKLTIHVEGYGEFNIDYPSVYNRETFSDTVAEVVKEVMNLVDPRTQKKRFHPAIGRGGYFNEGQDSKT